VWCTFSQRRLREGGEQHQLVRVQHLPVSWHGRGAVADEYGAPAPYRYANDQGRVQLSIGPLNFPAFPANSHAELYYMLQKALALDSSVDGMSFPPTEFRGTSHFEVFDLEKSNGTPGSGLQAYTGVSTRDTGDSDPALVVERDAQGRGAHADSGLRHDACGCIPSSDEGGGTRPGLARSMRPDGPRGVFGRPYGKEHMPQTKEGAKNNAWLQLCREMAATYRDGRPPARGKGMKANAWILYMRECARKYKARQRPKRANRLRERWSEPP
jgi:hypothetical protein